MTTPQPSRFGFVNRIRRWVGVQTLRPVAVNLVTQEMRQQQRVPAADFQALTRQWYGGQVTTAQWQLAIASQLKDAHLAQAMFAVGGKHNLNAENLARLRATLQKEYRFLDQFARDVVSGKVSEAQARARIAQYAQATQQSYWREYALNTPADEVIWWDLGVAEHCPDCLDLAAGSPYEPSELPTHPGAGDTQCRGKCQCTERREKRAA